MKRRILGILSALSLLVFVLALVLWVRSYDPGDYVRYYDSPRYFDSQSSDGLLRISWGQLTSKEYPPSPGWELSFWQPEGVHYTFKADLRSGTMIGFGYERWQRQTADLRADARIVTLPYWSLAAASAVLPLVMTWRWQRHRRARRRIASGLCPSCGYHLRATPERCPECGVITTVSAA